VRRIVSLPVICAALTSVSLLAQDAPPVFRSNVSRVTLSVTVRTANGKPVTNLTAADFRLFDSGREQRLADFRREPTPVSLGFLVDFSGSMGVGARRRAARENVHHLLSWLTPGTDRAGLFAFDRQLRVLQPMAPVPGDILAQLDNVERPFGATSLFDAIAETGRILASSSGPRRAVVAITDGADNASTLTPSEVSGLASSIDVPVYVVVAVSPLDRDGDQPFDEAAIAQLTEGPLGNLARWTGGEIYASLGTAQSSRNAQQVVSELRQQYLIAFEPDQRPGWHPIELRTNNAELIVRTRSGYFVTD
jgi:Ca-activated chloride channel family protein